MSCLEKCVFWVGIINAVIYGLLTCAGVAGCAYAFVVLVTQAYVDDIFILTGFSSLVALYFGFVSFFFCVLLIVGINKRKSELVMAYFIHLAVITIMLIAGTIAFWGYLRGEFAEYCEISTIFCTYKIIMLVLTIQTHRSLKESGSHQNSNENVYPKKNDQYLYVDRIGQPTKTSK